MTWIDLYRSWSGLMKGSWMKSLVCEGEGSQGVSKYEPPPQPGVSLVTYWRNLEPCLPPLCKLAEAESSSRRPCWVDSKHSEALRVPEALVSLPHSSCRPSPVHLYLGGFRARTRRHLEGMLFLILTAPCLFSRHLSFLSLSSLLWCTTSHPSHPFDVSFPSFSFPLVTLHSRTYLSSLLLKESDPHSSAAHYTVSTQLPPNLPSSALHPLHTTPPTPFSLPPPQHPSEPSFLQATLQGRLRSPITWKEMFLRWNRVMESCPNYAQRNNFLNAKFFSHQLLLNLWHQQLCLSLVRVHR